MNLTKNSGLVQIWVQLVLNGAKDIEEVPKLVNLQEIVASLVKEQKDKEIQNKGA